MLQLGFGSSSLMWEAATTPSTVRASVGGCINFLLSRRLALTILGLA